MTAVSEVLRVLLVDDEEIVHETLGSYLRDLGHHVDRALNAPTALKRLEGDRYDIVFSDIRMPGMDGIKLLEMMSLNWPQTLVVMITGHGSMDLAIQALRHGAADFLTKPVKLIEMDAIIERVLRLRRMDRDQGRLKGVIRELQSREDLRQVGGQMVAESAAMREVREKIRLAAQAACEAVLVTGDTGTGKEVVARELHNLSDPRHEKPFIAISCPALPETLVESELFGHVKGSFTGASGDKAGCFELADGGTLFLDEVGDLSAGAQSKLLRVLETRKVRRVGGSEENAVDVRVVAATNRTLSELVKNNKFRQDLYYRLNVFSIHLVPLSLRREDIIPLALRFLQAAVMRSGAPVEGFSEEANQFLLRYDYPGNIRELRNMIEGATIRCRSGLIGPEHFNVTEHVTPTAAGNSADERERETLVAALEEAKWNRRLAAKQLGMPYSTLRYKLKKFCLD